MAVMLSAMAEHVEKRQEAAMLSDACLTTELIIEKAAGQHTSCVVVSPATNGTRTTDTALGYNPVRSFT